MMIAELVFLLIKYLMGLGIGSVLFCREGGKSIREEAESVLSVLPFFRLLSNDTLPGLLQYSLLFFTGDKGTRSRKKQ